MNQLKSIIYLSQRGYKNIKRNKPLQIKKNNSIYTEKNLYPDINQFQPDDNDGDYDPDKLDADFSSVHKSYDEHHAEIQRNKELLKLRIVARKYFKSKDPNFLTWAEREQIKSLHNKDNDEWTAEKLSEAFPALPQSIKKILKSPHMFSTEQAVIKYDQNVIANWEKFKSGNLPLNPQLNAHLQKFKDRTFKLTDLKTIAKNLIKHEAKLPVPKNNLFTSIITNYTKQKTTIKDQQKLQLNNGKSTKNTENKELILNNSVNEFQSIKSYATFDKYIKQKIDKIIDDKNISLENQLLIKEYKNKTNQSIINDTELLVSTKQEVLPESIKPSKPTEPQVMQVPAMKIETFQNSLETGIIEWKKKSSNEENSYPKFIKIPHSKAETKITFKVNDRYYDCDGEFLYRVPGLNL